MDQNQANFFNLSKLDAALRDPRDLACTGLEGAAAALLIWRRFQGLGRTMLVVVPDAGRAETLVDDLSFFADRLAPNVLLFPAYNLSPYKGVDYHNETTASRIRVLYRLLETPQPLLVVAPVDALLKKIIPKVVLREYLELLLVGEVVDHPQLIHKLVDGGYNRVQLVEEPGDFSVRGGILDVFCPLYAEPLRIEFFDEWVESIRFFAPESQRTHQSIDEAVIAPARETVIRAQHLTEVVGRLRIRAADQELPTGETRRLVETVKAERRFPGIDNLMPLIYERLDGLLDYLPPDAALTLVEPADQQHMAAETLAKADQLYEAVVAERKLCVAPQTLFFPWDQIEAQFKGLPCLVVRQLSVQSAAELLPAATRRLDFNVGDHTVWSSKIQYERRHGVAFAPVAEWIRAQAAQKVAVGLVCRNRNQIARAAGIFAPYGIRLADEEAAPADATGEPEYRLAAWAGQISSGFVWPEAGLALLTDLELFGARQRLPRAKPAKPREAVIAFDDLRRGDLVVHADHGIGRYEGLAKLKLEGVTNDFVTIGYRGGDRLYLPVDRLAMIQKYMGIDGAAAPVLDKMGGKSWERIKARVKRSAEKIAGELLRLYAARKVRQGFTFRAMDDYMAEFEGGFPYEETPDQRQAIGHVLDDMQAPTPMDRLICGDVGYGKTEVALRAAFMAVFNGKQVAVLVPTTVLAEQHAETFQQRFKRFGVKVECLSRFRAAAEQRTIVAGLADGSVDIVVGTHRLLQKDVHFKDLGLFVIDEEQRFGVRHKEKLKKLRSAVDVLTLTATPIPRTLHLSLTGIRDISIISTPPEFRRSIITYVAEYSDGLVKEAVTRELARGGQVYFVHNHVASIQRMADKLQQIVPAARIGVAHGQMEEETLEKVMLAFHRRTLDVLVTTTIIESGLDIPAANTILVNKADRFGLSQMYQLRGRVGRSDEQAYAFLFIPKESHLTTDARKRLKVLMEYSDLGAGFQIAMNDLKIRGGGTILGASQSGHIAAVGYDMFLQLMEEAVAELKGEPLVEALDPEINLPFSCFIPDRYIPDIDQRLIMYRRLSKLRTIGEWRAMRAELIDRFGPLPKPASYLLAKIRIKMAAAALGIKRLDLNQGLLTLTVSPDHQANVAGLAELILSAPRRYKMAPDQTICVSLGAAELRKPLRAVKNILHEMAGHVNE